MSVQILKSSEDASVNFVFSDPDYKGYFEARYVRRNNDPKYFAVYLSSQSGCKQACRMCHLTNTRQTNAENATVDMFAKQASAVLDYYDQNCLPAEIVHYNFMARGEAFANPAFLEDSHSILTCLGNMAITCTRNLVPRFLISTIMPKNLRGRSLSKIFPVIHPEIYYSIYSVEDDFRRKWLPNAMPVDEALEMLKVYQENTKMIPKLHWAFIEGENDSEDAVERICNRVRRVDLRADFAIVRYNPYSEIYGKEPDESVIDRNIRLIQKHMPFSRVKKIIRVGKDVKASCGMFVEPNFTQIQK